MLRSAQGFAFVLTLVVAGFGLFQAPARAQAPAEDLLAEKAIGKADAPVTIIEYASLACPHCREFHEKTLPRIKEKYIDTGKVRLVFRDFPVGGPGIRMRATAASMIAHCSGPTRYFAMVSILFRDQAIWAQAPDGMAALAASAKKGGMSAPQVDACLRNEALLQGINKTAEDGHKTRGVESTPTFFVAGEKVEGAQDFRVFEDLIERALKK